jgi:integrase
MSRANRTGIKGLYWDEEEKRFRIDLRYKRPSGEADRYREIMAVGLSTTAAKARAREVLALAMTGGLKTAKAGAPRTLSAAFDFYLDHIEAELGKDAREDRDLHKRTWIGTVGDVPLSSLGPMLFDKFKAERRKEIVEKTGRKVSPATINRAIATMKHFVGRAAAWGWISKERGVEIRTEELKLLKEAPGRVRYLSDAERSKLDGALVKNTRRGSIRLVVLAGLYSGMRLGEIVGLRRDAIDMNQRTITLTKTKSNRRRTIFMGETLAEVVRQAMAEGTGELVFTSDKTGQPYTSGGVSSFFRTLVREAGVENLHYHDLRHDFATRLRRNGVGIDAISRLLGHATLTMSMKYAHLDDPTLRAAVAGLDPAVAQSTVAPPSPRKRKRTSSK